MLLRSLAPVLALLSTPAFAAQFDVVDEAWARGQSNDGLTALHPVEVEAYPDGGVLVVGLARALPLNALNLPGEVVLAKLNENGDSVWTDAIPSPPIPNGTFTGGRYVDATVTDQGDTFVVWSTPNTSFLRRYNASGAAIWTQTLAAPAGLTQYVAKFVETTPSGDLIVAGVGMLGAYPRMVVRAFAPNSTPLWEWRGIGDAGNPALSDPTGLTVGSNGRIHMHGRSDIPAYQHSGVVIALDAAGVFLWRYNAPVGGAVPDIALDSMGNVVMGIFGFPSIRVERLDAAGMLLSSTMATESGFSDAPTTVAVDAFDRIYVGVSRRPTGGVVRTPALFRFDAAGAYLGLTQPSVAGPGEDGMIVDMIVTSRNDVVTLGYSGTGIDEIFAARFAPDGTERWALKRRGRRALESPSPATAFGVGMSVDSRGNPFTIAQTVLDGVYPNLSLGADVVKFVQNGPAGAAYCAPAPVNSTGVPAELAALGPGMAGSNNITLRVDALPPSALTLFLASRTQGSTPNAGGGQGTLCLGGSIGRFYGPGQIRTATPEGSASLQLNLASLPQPNGSVAAVVGETWNFQAWYRDANPTLTSNLSSAVSVTLQ